MKPSWLILTTLLLIPASDLRAQPTLEESIRRVQPSKAEDRWLSIPWEQNLMRGRAEAARLNKPMLIWIMDGNVLGCT